MPNYKGYSDFGGFVCWLCIKIGKTKLSEEQDDTKRERNVVVFFITVFIIAIITLKFIPLFSS